MNGLFYWTWKGQQFAFKWSKYIFPPQGKRKSQPRNWSFAVKLFMLIIVWYDLMQVSLLTSWKVISTNRFWFFTWEACNQRWKGIMAWWWCSYCFCVTQFPWLHRKKRVTVLSFRDPLRSTRYYYSFFFLSVFVSSMVAVSCLVVVGGDRRKLWRRWEVFHVGSHCNKRR